MAGETVQLYAAGSLRTALTQVAAAFENADGAKVLLKFGPSGLLKEEIAAGAAAHVFASANMEHPQALAKLGKGGPVVLFARNRLCALVRPGLAVTPDTLLERMLDPQIKLATSTPKADPSGDYAFQVFAQAESLQAGARAALERKALQLTGGASSPSVPPGRNLYGMLIAQGSADIFLAYCTGAREAQGENPGQQVVALPAALAVGADYGLTVMANAPSAAYRLALFLLSSAGQDILARLGFFAPAQVK